MVSDMQNAIRVAFLGAVLGTSACTDIADIHEGKPPVEEEDQVGVPMPECMPLPECTGGTKLVLAMDKIFLGNTNPDGEPNLEAGWKQYGFNLDNRRSHKGSTDLCKPSSGGYVPWVYPDGNDGIDNAFGKNIFPEWVGLVSDLGQHTPDRITNGEFTYMIAIDDIGQGEPCSTRSALFTGAPLGAPPLWDGNDAWPIDPDSLTDPSNQTSAKTVLGTSAIVGDVFTSCHGANFDLILTVPDPEVTLRIPVHHARFQMQLDPDRQGATSGIIGGIIGREELVDAVAGILGAFHMPWCDQPDVGVLNHIRQAADIMLDGSQTPDQVCDGISIGLGFTMKRVKLGGVGASPPPPPDPCAP
jgi:hypothetical protein